MTSGMITSMKQFDSKAMVEKYICGLPIKSTFYVAGFYGGFLCRLLLLIRNVRVYIEREISITRLC